MAESYQPQRSWKLGRTSRSATGKGPAHDAGSGGGEKTVDVGHKSSSTPSSPRRKGGWFQKHKANPTLNRYDRPDGPPEKQGMSVVDVRDGISGLNCCTGRGSGPNR